MSISFSPFVSSHFRDLMGLLNNVLIYLDHSETMESAVDVLIELVTQPINTNYSKTICEGLISKFTNGTVRNIWNQSVCGKYCSKLE
jgi:hypothetical protein